MLPFGGASSSDARTAPKQQTLYGWGWRDIDGGRELEGNAILGQRHVRFVRPVQVAARGNFVFVVDAGVQLLYRYDLSRDQLAVVLDLRAVTVGEVSDIYLYQDHSFLLVDPDAGRVLHFDRNGRLIRTFEDRLNLIRPVAVTYDEQMGRVLIADGSSDDILVFTSTGQLQGVIGSRGLTEGKFLNLTAITSGERGIYATARLGHRVQLMGRDGSHQKTFQPDTVVFPLAIAVDKSGNTFVSDYLDNSIKVFQNDLFLESIGSSGIGPGRFKRITDLWYDDGFLYAVDSLNGRIQVLRVEMVEPEALPESADELIDNELDDVLSDEFDDLAESRDADAMVLDEPQVLDAALSESEKTQAAQTELAAGKAEVAGEVSLESPVISDEVLPESSQVNGTPDRTVQE